MFFAIITPAIVIANNCGKIGSHHAVSISGMLITLAAMITDKPEPKKAGAQAPGMGMGGMM